MENQSFKDFHVLIVDDDLAFLDLLEVMLGAIGIKTVTRADSGAQAFSAITELKRPVDCTICDFKMSNGNGLQLLKIIRMGRVKFLRPDACFILLTASGESEVVATAAQLDVNAYLIKPVTPEKLKTAIQKARGKYFPVDFRKYAQVIVPEPS